MKITLQKAIEILQNCSAVIADDNALSYPAIWDEDLENDEYQFLQVRWDNEEGEEFCASFEVGSNKEVEVVGSSMFLVDNEGETIQLTILSPWNVEEEVRK